MRAAAGQSHRRSAGGRVLGRRALLLVPLALLLAGCIPTTYLYPVDFFNEMHYQQSYRRQESPRLSVPDGAVPTTGGSPILSSQSLSQLKNPVQRTPEGLRRAAALYERNCAMCHGPQGKGDGIIAAYFKAVPNTPVPLPYDAPRTKALGDGDLFATITNGLRDEKTLVGMPAFRKLLTDEERWLLVNQIRTFQGQ